ncbi:hypothetical protein A7L51_19470 [Acinetobacter baumannii]|nr:hypothetical protein A7L51_19470 [Acinetobacter baumannii]
MALGSSDASNRRHGRGRSCAQGLSSAAVGSDGVLYGRALVAVGAVVVADEHVAVDIAEADEVVSLLLAGFDARLVAGDACVYDVLSIALLLRSDEAGARGEDNGKGG